MPLGPQLFIIIIIIIIYNFSSCSFSLCFLIIQKISIFLFP